ncbi:MAG: hypothetical protein Q7S21_00495 [archaeon]|nr:hypothetical protein [archaeon]
MQKQLKHGWMTVFFSLFLLIFVVWIFFNNQPENNRISAIFLFAGAMLSAHPAYQGITKQYIPIPGKITSFKGKTAIFTGIVYLLVAIGCIYLGARMLIVT